MLITGAASGFGLELAKRFVARGDSVIATDLHDSANEDVVKLGDACTYRELDVTSDADREAAAAAIGAVDVLVLNAGIAVSGAIENVTMDTWHRALDINLLGAVRGCRAFVPLLEPAAKIVMTSSIAGLIPPLAPERVKVSLNALSLRSDVATNHRRDSDWCIPEKLLLVFVLLEGASIVIPDGGDICQFACRRCGVLLEQSTTVAGSGGRESPCATVSSSSTRGSASSTRSSRSSAVARTD